MKTTLRRLSAVATALGLAASAHAVGILTLESGLSSVSVTDGGVGDANPAAGATTFIGSVGVWNINVSTGLSYPVTGSPVSPHIDLNSVNNSSGAGTLIITFSDTFTTGELGLLASIGGTVDTGGSLLYEVLVNGAPVTSVGPFSPIAFSGSAVGVVAGGTNYTLMQRITINHAGAGASSFDAELRPVPDLGSTLALLGASLIGVGLLRRRFNSKD